MKARRGMLNPDSKDGGEPGSLAGSQAPATPPFEFGLKLEAAV